MDSTSKSPEQPCEQKWYQKISVEPTMFLYMMAFMITSVVEQAFFVNKACLVNHNHTAEICDTLDNYPLIKKEVQVTVSNFHQWNGIAGHVVPIILALFLGSWSDRRGRKLPLLMGLLGKLVYSAMVVVNAYQPTWPLENVIYTATLPSALTGADVAIFASAFAYISDVSSSEERTMRVTILDVCYLSTMPTGVALGSYLFSSVFDKSYAIMFIINSSLMCLAIMYSLIHLKWQTTSRQQSIREIGYGNAVCDFFDKQHVVDSVKTITTKRPGKRRTYLWVILIAMALYTFQRDEKPMTFLYTQYKFNWDTVIYSNFKTFQSTAYVLAMLIGVPIMSKVLNWKDTTIIMWGATAHASARLFFGLAEVPWVFWVGGGISSLGPIVAPALRSMTSKLVPMRERGKVFALLSVCDNAVPFFSGVLYTQVYNATIGKSAGIFWLTLATQVVVFFCALAIHLSLGDEDITVVETVQKDILIEDEPREGSAS